MDAPGSVNPERIGLAEHRRGAVGTAVLAVVWIGLALWRPTATVHMAPFLVAGAWPFLLRRGPLRVANIDALRGALASLTVAIVSAFVLLAADALRGPTLWDSGHAMFEIIPIAVIGAGVGYRYARCGVAAE
jgi:hypothetical protein